MPSVSATNNRVRGLFAVGFISWILLTISLFTPEWTRQDDKHCGVIFCCLSLYGNCTLVDTAIVAGEFSYIFSSWMICFVAICSSTCRCTDVKVENVRQMAVLLVIAGVLALAGTIEFFVRKFTNDELDFAAGGFVAHASAWMLFISGCCGYCHGYDYDDGSDFYENAIYPVEMTGPGREPPTHSFGPAAASESNWKTMQGMKTLPGFSERGPV